MEKVGPRRIPGSSEVYCKSVLEEAAPCLDRSGVPMCKVMPGECSMHTFECTCKCTARSSSGDCRSG